MFSMGRLLYRRRVVFGRVPYTAHFGIYLGTFFCSSMTVGFIQKSFDNTLSMSSFSSHLCRWCVWFAIIAKLCSLSSDSGHIFWNLDLKGEVHSLWAFVYKVAFQEYKDNIFLIQMEASNVFHEEIIHANFS